MSPTPPRIIEITADRSWLRLGLHEIWQYRELLFFLAWRDLKVRYRQTLLGMAWAVVVPCATVAVFTFSFGKLAGIGSGDLPYPLFSLAGLLPWRLYQTIVVHSTGSLLRSPALINRVYCPRLIVPAAASVPAVVDFAIAMIALAAAAFYYRVPVVWTWFLLPAVIALTVLSALAVGVLLAAAYVRFRDVEYVVRFALHLLLFLSPVIYPAENVYGFLEAHGLPRWLYGLNPVTGIIESFRACMTGSLEALGPTVLASVVVSAALVVLGVLYFRSQEETFADYL